MSKRGEKLTFPRLHSWLCLLAAGPFVVTALVGLEYGGAVPFAVLAGLFFLQAFIPTRAGWAVVFLVSSVAAAYMTFIVLSDIAALSAGRAVTAFLDGSDTAMTILLWLLSSSLTVGMFLTRPVKHQQPGATVT